MLRNLINQKIMIEQKELKSNEEAMRTAESNPKAVLTFAEAVAYMGLSPSYVYKLTSGRKIPHYKPCGKVLFFNRLELESWLQQNRVATSDELKECAMNYCVTTKAGRRK